MQRRNAFTLVELLVVIAIIAILASLTAAAVQKVRERGRDVQCRADIQQLGSAIAQFKAKFGVYPPCSGSGPGGSFILCYDYINLPATAPEVALMKQMFPRMSMSDNGLRRDITVNYSATPGANTYRATSNPLYLDPNQALIVFLSGGTLTDFQGFSTKPDEPFRAAYGSTTGARLNGGPMWDGFASPSKRTTPTEYFNTVGGANQRFTNDNADSMAQPWFIDPWGTPYLYFCSTTGNDYPFAGTTGFSMAPWNMDTDTSNNLQIRPHRETANRFVEQRGFQILSAARNRLFGEGGQRTPGSGSYALNRNGGDDYANFQQTPLGVTD